MPEALAKSHSGPEKYKVLVPVSTSREDLPFVESLPHLFRGLTHPAEVHLFHALSLRELNLRPSVGGSFYEALTQRKAEIARTLSEYAGTLTQKLPTHAVQTILLGEELTAPAEAVQTFLQEHPIDLLVAFYKGRQRWESWVGRTAFWDLYEEVKSGVLAVSHPPTFPPKRFLWLMEMDTEDYRYLPTVLHIIRLFGGTLYCAKVNTPSSFYTHREFQRRVLAFCDYIVDHIDPDFVPQECLQYDDKDLATGAQHVMEDFLMDVLLITPDSSLDISAAGRLLQTGNFALLKLPPV